MKDDFVAKVAPTSEGGWSISLWEETARGRYTSTPSELAARFDMRLNVYGFALTEEEAVRVADAMLRAIRKAKANSSRQPFEVR